MDFLYMQKCVCDSEREAKSIWSEWVRSTGPQLPPTRSIWALWRLKSGLQSKSTGLPSVKHCCIFPLKSVKAIYGSWTPQCLINGWAALKEMCKWVQTTGHSQASFPQWLDQDLLPYNDVFIILHPSPPLPIFSTPFDHLRRQHCEKLQLTMSSCLHDSGLNVHHTKLKLIRRSNLLTP